VITSNGVIIAVAGRTIPEKKKHGKIMEKIGVLIGKSLN
jgi:hypothetical protein